MSHVSFKRKCHYNEVCQQNGHGVDRMHTGTSMNHKLEIKGVSFFQAEL